MDDGKKAGRKARYDWPRLQDGRWRTFRHSEGAKSGRNLFSCNPQSFVAILHARKKLVGLDVETQTKGLKVRFRFTNADGTPIVREEARAVG